MKKKLHKIRPLISSTIDIVNTWQTIRWCVELGCTAEKLQVAVEKVGPSADAVREYLKRS